MPAENTQARRTFPIGFLLNFSRKIGCNMKQTISGSLVSLLRRLLLLFGILTGGAMAVFGLMLRLQDSIPQGGLAAWFGVPFFQAVGLSAGRIGWMLVLEGIFWIAALSALGVRNYWGWWSSMAAGLISMLFFPGGTLAGILILLMVGIRLIRDRFAKAQIGKSSP
jgi:hypothetical protein